ncbi:unnamed protein product [Dovyalis caffra]|uniref:Reverse transcriptase domain-containing protein n=1 Tax=Dovyalis caffra TaxID=77055 RepID=A0AAV1RNQ5_9ROSI|nr:unnamed protein product [Dovyalis caffra]
MNRALTADVVDGEIEVALKQINPNKASKPDGMTLKLILAFWDIVGKDIMEEKFEVEIKLDIGKAYDQVEWGYTEAIMRRAYNSQVIRSILEDYGLASGQHFGRKEDFKPVFEMEIRSTYGMMLGCLDLLLSEFFQGGPPVYRELLISWFLILGDGMSTNVRFV